MVRVYNVDLLCLYLFLRVYQSLKSGMWNDNSSTFSASIRVNTERTTYFIYSLKND